MVATCLYDQFPTPPAGRRDPINVVYLKEDVARMQGSQQEVEEDSGLDTAENLARAHNEDLDDVDDLSSDEKEPPDSPPPTKPKGSVKRRALNMVPPPEPARGKPKLLSLRASGRVKPTKRNGSQKVLAVVDGNLEGSSALLDALNSLKTRVTEDKVAMGSRGFVKLHLSNPTMWRATDELKRKAAMTPAQAKRKKVCKKSAGTISFRIRWKYLQLMHDTGFRTRAEYVFKFDLIFRHNKTEMVGALEFKNMRFSQFNDARKCTVLESEVGAFLFKCREAVKKSH